MRKASVTAMVDASRPQLQLSHKKMQAFFATFALYALAWI